MGNFMRDNIGWGEGNIANRVGGKDIIRIDDDHHSTHRKQIV